MSTASVPASRLVETIQPSASSRSLARPPRTSSSSPRRRTRRASFIEASIASRKCSAGALRPSHTREMKFPVGRAVAHDSGASEARFAGQRELREIVGVESVRLEDDGQELPELDRVLHVLEARLDAGFEIIGTEPVRVDLPKAYVAASRLVELDHLRLDLGIRGPGLEMSRDGARDDFVEEGRLLRGRALAGHLIEKGVESTRPLQHSPA